MQFTCIYVFDSQWFETFHGAIKFPVPELFRGPQSHGKIRRQHVGRVEEEEGHVIHHGQSGRLRYVVKRSQAANIFEYDPFESLWN